MSYLDDYISYAGIFLGLIFFAVLAVHYWRCWKQLQNALSQSGTQWPPHSQEELNTTAQTSLPRFYKKSSVNMAAAARVIFSIRTDDPAIQKPLRRIRRILISFFLFPVFLAVVIVVIAAFRAT